MTKEEQKDVFKKGQGISESEKVFLSHANQDDRGAEDFMQSHEVNANDPKAVFAQRGMNKAMHPSASVFFRKG